MERAIPDYSRNRRHLTWSLISPAPVVCRALSTTNINKLLTQAVPLQSHGHCENKSCTAYWPFHGYSGLTDHIRWPQFVSTRQNWQLDNCAESALIRSDRRDNRACRIPAIETGYNSCPASMHSRRKTKRVYIHCPALELPAFPGFGEYPRCDCAIAASGSVKVVVQKVIEPAFDSNANPVD